MDFSLFWDNLKRLCKAKNLKLGDFSNKIDISNTQLSNYNAFKRYPHITVLKKMANVLGVSIDYLLLGDKVDYTNEISKRERDFLIFLKRDKEMATLFAKILILEDSQKNLIIQMVETLYNLLKLQKENKDLKDIDAELMNFIFR